MLQIICRCFITHYFNLCAFDVLIITNIPSVLSFLAPPAPASFCDRWMVSKSPHASAVLLQH